MKKSIFSLAIVSMMVLFASCGSEKKNTIVLDLSNPTTELQFDETNLWTGTYDMAINAFESQVFSFQHFAGESEYNGYTFPYYMGWTVSKDASASARAPEASIAKGGKAGEGTPYMICYWGDYYVNDTRYNTSVITFDNAYDPQYVYISNTAQVVDCIEKGNSYGARKFDADDYFTLTFTALDQNKQPIAGSEVVYYLADFRDGKSFINKGWEKVDLSALGTCYGINFTMETTDVVTYDGTTYYAQTPTYFALDGLTVKEK